jgi:hypothetical protein
MRDHGTFTGPTFIGLLIPVMILASACSHTVEPYRPDVSTSPATPIKLAPRPADRAATATAPPLAKAVESTLPITLAGDLTPLQDAVSAAVPESFDETRSPMAREFRWTFQRQGAPQVFVQNGQLMVHAEYRGDIELKSSTARACHLDPVYPTLDWNARLTTKQEGPNLVIRPEAPETSLGLKPDSDDKCNMFAGPLRDQLPELINPKEVQEQIAQAVTKAAVAIPIHDVWDQLHGPYIAPLTSVTALCIYPDPSEIMLGSVEARSSRLCSGAWRKWTPMHSLRSRVSGHAASRTRSRRVSLPCRSAGRLFSRRCYPSPIRCSANGYRRRCSIPRRRCLSGGYSASTN